MHVDLDGFRPLIERLTGLIHGRREDGFATGITPIATTGRADPVHGRDEASPRPSQGGRIGFVHGVLRQEGFAARRRQGGGTVVGGGGGTQIDGDLQRRQGLTDGGHDRRGKRCG